MKVCAGRLAVAKWGDPRRMRRQCFKEKQRLQDRQAHPFEQERSSAASSRASTREESAAKSSEKLKRIARNAPNRTKSGTCLEAEIAAKTKNRSGPAQASDRRRKRRSATSLAG